MSSFEYVMFLFSIIVGLAITTLIDGFVRAFRRHTGLRPGPIHTLWCVALFAYIILFWMSRWSLAGVVTVWTPALVLTSLLLPMAVYGWAAILFPPKGEDVALDDYFIDNRRALYGVGILVLTAQFMGGWILFGAGGQFQGGSVGMPPHAARRPELPGLHLAGRDEHSSRTTEFQSRYAAPTTIPGRPGGSPALLSMLLE